MDMQGKHEMFSDKSSIHTEGKETEELVTPNRLSRR